MKVITKEELIERLKEIRAMGWIENARNGNAGGVGNTLEDLLGIEENNLPIPNAAEWELKCQRLNASGRASSYTTLFHLEPSPRALRFVPEILLPKYGWSHAEAGRRYSDAERSFRQTIGTSRSDRGFCVVVDRTNRKVCISFDSGSVSIRHREWLSCVERQVGLGELDPQPYWGFEDLFHKAGTKIHNCFMVGARVKKEKAREYFLYERIQMLSGFEIEHFISAIERSDIVVDFDARTGHNHGTKFRYKPSLLTSLYQNVEEL